MKECIDDGTLQAYFDNELGVEAATGVSTHLASCLTCAQTARAVEAENLFLANALEAEFAESIPTERLRRRLEASIAPPQIVKSNPSADSTRGWWASLGVVFFPSLPRAFAYGSLAAVIVLSAIFGLVYFQRARVSSVVRVEPPKLVPLPSAAASPAPSFTFPVPEVKRVAGPQQTVARRVPRPSTTTNELLPGERNYVKTIAALNSTIKSDVPLRPSLRVDYEHNVALLDSAIEMTRDAARKNPKDAQARKFMYAAYQSKVELLNQVADAGRFNTEK
jgi:hypothetical protein